MNNFIYETHYQKELDDNNNKEKKNNEFIKKKDSIVKLRFETGQYDFDLDEINLGEDNDIIETILFDYKNNPNNLNTNLSTKILLENNSISDEIKTRKKNNPVKIYN